VELSAVTRTLPVSLILAAVLCWPAAPMLAQGIPEMDSTRLQPVTAAGQYLVHWTYDDGTDQQAIYFKNTSKDRAVTITSWELYDCIKVAGLSGRKHDSGPTIKPGKTVRLHSVRGQRSDDGFAFKYRFTAEWADTTSRLK
jgi:hypothetical protein